MKALAENLSFICRSLHYSRIKALSNSKSFSFYRVLAAHLTRADLELLNGTGDCDYGLGVSSGIELVTLPHGAQLRTDLIER